MNQFYTGQEIGENVIYFDFNPDIEPEYDYGCNHLLLDTTMDLNMDNIEDIRFEQIGAHSLGSFWSDFLVTSLNDTYVSVKNTWANNLDINNIINENLYWSNEENRILSIFQGIYGIEPCIFGLWDNSDTSYLPIKLNDGYAWIRLSTDHHGYTTRIYDYAYKKNTISIGETIIDQIRVYPNPVSDYLYIDCPLNNCDVVIYNVLGKSVCQSRLSTPFNKLLLNELNSGVYLVHIRHKNDCYSFRIIKQ